MVNITKPPIHNFFNNYNTIVKESQEHQNLFPVVGPIDFSIYKRRTSTVNYDIIEAAKHAQLQLEAIQYNQEGENNQEILDDSKEQAKKFQSLLGDKPLNAKKGGKGVRFGISISMTGEDDVPKEFIDYHIDDNEDKEKLYARRLLFTTLRGAKDSLAIIRPKFNVREPPKFKKLIPEPEPIKAIDVLVELLANMYLPFQPPSSKLTHMQEKCDVIVTVRKSFQAQDTERILCHSEILSQSSNAFKEMFDLYVWDMELQEKHDTHCSTTTDEGVWRLTNRIIPIYLPCHIHIEETMRPPVVIKNKIGIDKVDPCCSRHETNEDWIDPKNERTQCEEPERASDYELEENPLYEDYRKLVDEELTNDAEEFVQNQNAEETLSIEKNIDDEFATEPLPFVEGEDHEVNWVEELTNLREDMELMERRKFEANALLTTCKPFLYSLATSEVKETFDDQMLNDLQKFVTLADMYFVLTNPKVNDNNHRGVKFQSDFLDGKLNSIIVEGNLHESFRKSLNVEQREGKEEKDLVLIDNDSRRSTNQDLYRGNSKNGSIEQISGSQIKSPSEVFAELKARRRESLSRKRKSVIRKILYPIERTPLIEPGAHLLEIEQQLDLCLPPPMAWQLPVEGHEEEPKEEIPGNVGTKEGDSGFSLIDSEQGDEGNKEVEVLQSEGNVETNEEDEEDEEPEEDVCKREHQHQTIQKAEPEEALRIYKIIKGEWTSAIFYPMLEYFYTERCHVSCENVAALWKASTQILLQSLTNVIVLHPIVEYCHLALKTETNRRSLLILANASYKSKIGSNMKKLKHFCELFKYGASNDFLPYTFNLFTAYMVDRKIDIVEEGFYELPNFNVCILKVYDKKEQLFAQNANGLEYLTFEKCLQDQSQHCQHIREHWHGRKVDDPFFDNNRHKQWAITVFGPSFPDECFKFYEYLVGQTFRIKEQETFSLHMPIPYLKQPVLHKALAKAFTKDKLCIESNRGMSYYVGGETHGNSLTLTGSPLFILEAIKCIPRDMVARMALRFQAPTKNTFLKVFSITRTIGIDIEKDQIFLLKNYKKIKLALEYYLGLSDTAFIPLDVPREFTELIVPSKPF